jgi:transposase-like protein
MYHIEAMRKHQDSNRPELEKSEIVEALPLACADENAAVEFMEEQRWGSEPKCPHCQGKNVYKMTDRDGTRNKRYLWRCRQCGEQYTVRIGTVYEETRMPLKHWCYAFWRACSSKKGVAAREIQRHCQISYKSALFLMHRIRFAMTPDNQPPLEGIVEADETYVGGKPRPGTGPHKRGRGTSKTPVFAMVQRDGSIRRKVIADVTAKTLHSAICEAVSPDARIMTDEFPAYRGLGEKLGGGHDVIRHKDGHYADGDIHTNTAESAFSLLKRGINGIFHAVSKEHLHRYVSEFDYRWNTRKMDDGERVVKAIKDSQGKRLTYRPLVEQGKRGNIVSLPLPASEQGEQSDDLIA